MIFLNNFDGTYIKIILMDNNGTYVYVFNKIIMYTATYVCSQIDTTFL